MRNKIIATCNRCNIASLTQDEIVDLLDRLGICGIPQHGSMLVATMDFMASKICFVEFWRILRAKLDDNKKRNEEIERIVDERNKGLEELENE